MSSSQKPHLILLGAPGSGKGTQSAKLVENNNYKHISTGNLLREEIAKKSELGLRVKAVMDSGNLVSDEIVVELLSNLNLDYESYIFDGYPRNIEQSKTLTQILGQRSHKAIYFELDTDLLVNRLTKRRVTKDGKHIYNLDSNPPKVAGICDITGEELIHRDDDKEEVIRSRMNVFSNTIQPILNYFDGQSRLVKVDASQSLEDVYEDLLSKVR